MERHDDAGRIEVHAHFPFLRRSPFLDFLCGPLRSLRLCGEIVSLVLLALATTADAAAPVRSGLTLRFPSADLPGIGNLNAALQDPTVGTIIFERGTNPFSSAIVVFRRDHLTLKGATKRAEDTILESTASVALLLEECRDVRIENLTIRSTDDNGECVRLQAARGATVEGFVEDVAIRRCRLESWIPLRGTVRAAALDVADSKIVVTRSGGAGVLWEDGPALQVTRTTFSTAPTVLASATAAVLLRGAFVPESEGDRAKRLTLTRNRVEGDFITGFDLSDLEDARISRNRIEFASPFYSGQSGDAGRAGIVVRRAAAAALTENFEIRKNVVRGAHTGVWALNTSDGVVVGNDLRRSGAATAETRFGDTGCALRIGLFGPRCPLRVEGNDFRDLRSPASPEPGQPACVVAPAANGGGCFPEGARNRTDPGRNLFGESVQ